MAEAAPFEVAVEGRASDDALGGGAWQEDGDGDGAKTGVGSSLGEANICEGVCGS